MPTSKEIPTVIACGSRDSEDSSGSSIVCLKEFWIKHEKKVYVTFGVISNEFLLYKLYDGNMQRISELEKKPEAEKKIDERVSAQFSF
ncbi:unnamed protein product [Cuscuta campestris]|uniref:Uncharacterized protein n=1 Tax=Cuscuta campestris TaxID=132261 RepID=A0A484LH53_9ASTE|nr:unnamed protein product [Cuscuta campestris]